MLTGNPELTEGPILTGNPELTEEPTETGSPENTEKPIETEKVIPYENMVCVYYDNPGWSDVYIHYKVDNGTWTKIPGIAMKENSDVEGYTWKSIINLGGQYGATVCFNNGNGSWDTSNGLNYKVYSGVYGVKDGQVIKLDTSPVITSIPQITETPKFTLQPNRNTVCVYYYNATWEKANIHYKIGNESWHIYRT
jgi:hypothetical protein